MTQWDKALGHDPKDFWNEVATQYFAMDVHDDELKDDTAPEIPEFVKTLAQGAKKRLVRAATAVQEAFASETQREPKGEKQTPKRKRRPGPLRLLEICTWTAMVSQVARSRGWQVGEPVNLESGFNPFTVGGQRRCNDYLRSFQQDAVVFAFPCTTWSVMHQLNQRTPQHTLAT